MRRNGSLPPDDCDWYDEVDDASTGPEAGRSVRVSTLTWGGLALMILVAVALVWIVRVPEKPTARARFHRAPSPLGSVAFAPDGRSLALGRSDGGLVIENLSGGPDLELEPSLGVWSLARGLAYSPDARTLASGGRGLAVKLWDVETGTLKASFEGHKSPVASVAYSPDGKSLASGSLDGAVKLWDVATGEELAGIAGHALDVRGLAFSPDGKTLASGSLDGLVKLWDVANGRELASVKGGGRRVYALAFAPDGRSLALGLSPSSTEMKGQLVLWHPAESRRPFRVFGEANIAAVAFSPDGRTVVTGGQDTLVGRFELQPDPLKRNEHQL